MPGAVELDDDAIADGEAAAGGHELVRAEPPGGLHDRAGSAVELAHVGAVVGDHQAAVGVGGDVPVGHHSLEDLATVASDVDAAVAFVESERLFALAA